MDHFERTGLAELSGLTANGLNVLVARRLVPTLIDDPGRVVATAFDALPLAIADMFCTKGGFDRGMIAKAIHQHLDDFYDLAQRIDAGEQNLVVLIALTEDLSYHVIGGPFGKVLEKITPQVRSRSLRVCFVSANAAAALVRRRAKKANIDIGGFAMTKAEVAAIAKNPFGRRDQKKMVTEVLASKVQ
jgi:hypothetical protein